MNERGRRESCRGYPNVAGAVEPGGTQPCAYTRLAKSVGEGICVLRERRFCGKRRGEHPRQYLTDAFLSSLKEKGNRRVLSRVPDGACAQIPLAIVSACNRVNHSFVISCLSAQHDNRIIRRVTNNEQGEKNPH
jgi:hypothetical protein